MICEIETQVYKHNKVKFMNILTKNLSLNIERQLVRLAW